jgi:hypothetical protein
MSFYVILKRLAKFMKMGRHNFPLGFVASLYAEVLELGDGRPLFCKDFVEKNDKVTLKVCVLNASRFREM